MDQTNGKFQMHGSLVGAWNVTKFKVHYAEHDGKFVASGAELFKGCHDADRNGRCDTGEPAGTLRFSFVSWGRVKPGTEQLIRGDCVHPVLGGTGAFARATGVVHMVDLPWKGGIRTTYTGTLLVPGVASASTQPSQVRQPASRAIAARAPRGCGR